jgi:hypothetical protein
MQVTKRLMSKACNNRPDLSGRPEAALGVAIPARLAPSRRHIMILSRRLDVLNRERPA